MRILHYKCPACGSYCTRDELGAEPAACEICGGALAKPFHTDVLEGESQRNERQLAIRRAIGHLRMARELLRRAGARKTINKVRWALKSADGAARHASHDHYREERRHDRQD